jgi:hypothetical protein
MAGVYSPLQEGIPGNLLILMGISVEVSIVSTAIFTFKKWTGLHTDISPVKKMKKEIGKIHDQVYPKCYVNLKNQH